MPRILACFALFAILAATLSPASAANDKLWQVCQNGTTPDPRIEACTKILAGEESGQNKAIAHYNRGNAYLKKGDHDLAIADYDRAIKLDPRYADAYNNRGSAYLDKHGNAYFNFGYDRHIADYNKAIELDPKFAFAYRNRGLAYELKREFSLAAEDYERAMKLGDKDAEAKLAALLGQTAAQESERGAAAFEYGSSGCTAGAAGRGPAS